MTTAAGAAVQPAAPFAPRPLHAARPWEAIRGGRREVPTWQLDAHAVAELDAALARARGRPLACLDRDDFPLPSLAGTLAALSAELADGTGVARLTGLPVARYTPAALRTVFFGLGLHLGTPVQQNGGRGLMRDIRDSSARGGTRVDSAGALAWHNDRADVVGLLCLRAAGRGGVSRVVSVPALHDVMLARHPQRVATLYGDFHRHSPGDEVGRTGTSYALPVFALAGGRFTTHYSRTYIEQAQGLAGVPALTDAQLDALECLRTLADELAVEMALAPGDMQFLNNHLVYHGRTPFEDDARGGRMRWLFRLWLTLHPPWPLPAAHAPAWGR